MIPHDGDLRVVPWENMVVVVGFQSGLVQSIDKETGQQGISAYGFSIIVHDPESDDENEGLIETPLFVAARGDIEEIILSLREMLELEKFE